MGIAAPCSLTALLSVRAELGRFQSALCHSHLTDTVRRKGAKARGHFLTKESPLFRTRGAFPSQVRAAHSLTLVS